MFDLTQTVSELALAFEKFADALSQMTSWEWEMFSDPDKGYSRNDGSQFYIPLSRYR